jgi:hypothetical protein
MHLIWGTRNKPEIVAISAKEKKDKGKLLCGYGRRLGSVLNLSSTIFPSE